MTSIWIREKHGNVLFNNKKKECDQIVVTAQVSFKNEINNYEQFCTSTVFYIV